MPVHRVSIHDPLGLEIAVTELYGDLSAANLNEELLAEYSRWLGNL